MTAHSSNHLEKSVQMPDDCTRAKKKSRNCKCLSKCYGGCNTYVQRTYNTPLMTNSSYEKCFNDFAMRETVWGRVCPERR